MKTKSIIIPFFILIMALVIPQNVRAYDFSYTYQGQTLYYRIVNGEAWVTYQNYNSNDNSPRYSNLSGTLVIPSNVTYSGTSYSVTSIDGNAFRNCSGLTSVTFPNSVTFIGSNAFWGCGGLTSVTISYSVTSIGSDAFRNCSGLTSVTIPNSVTSIGTRAFYGCSGLTSVTIPNSVTYIQSQTFQGCSGLTSVTIPNSVTSIGSSAFSGCRGLASVFIPNSVTSIYQDAFSGCSGLTSVTIPNSVTSIGQSAFYNCSGLTSVTIPNSVTAIGQSAFAGCNSIHLLTYNCPDNLLGSINKTNLQTVVIGDSVVSISSQLFQNCTNLTSVTIGDSVTSIGNQAFSGCSGLTSIVVSNGNTHYDSRNNCNAIIVTSTNTLIVGCQNTVIPNSVTTIGNHAFYNCSGLTSVTIPNSVTTIGYLAFDNCSGLTSVTIGNSVTSIGSSAFSGCSGLTSVTIPNSVTSIGHSAFYNCSGLTSVIIGNSVTSIDDHAFSGCSGLTSVTIPNSVTFIGWRAFYGCSGLTSVTIGNSVTSIGSDAFRNCSGLTSVTIGNSVTSIYQDAFSGCSGLTSVNYTGTIAQWCGIAFGGTQFSNPTFYSHSLSINGSPLTNLVIPGGVTEIKSFAFIYCSGLTSVTIPNSVTSIGQYAFYNCSGLTSVTIGNSVTSIGNYAFDYCSGLTEITSLAVVAPSLGNYAFYNMPDSIPVYIPCSSTASYQQSTWNYFSNFIESSASNIDVQTANSTMGAATIMTHPTCFDSTVVITATANYGYHFTQWNDGNTQNPRTITLTQDTTFTALFDRNQYSVTGVANNSTRGTVTGSDTVYYLDTVTLEAVAIDGYYFQKWNDNNTANPRQIVATGNITKTAIFNPNQYSITLSVDTSIHGSCSGGGNYNYLSNRTITATANYGYHFTQWNDGNTQNPRTITLTQDTTFTALFDRNQYSVTGVANNSTRGTVTGSDTVYYLDTVTLEAVAIDGYYFQKWNDNNTANPRQIVATGNITKTAIFNPNQYSITLSVDTSIHGSCSGGGNYNYLSNRTITATANYGYHFTQWNDGNTQNPRTITLTQDTTFTAMFAKNIYIVTVVSNDNTRGTVAGNDTVEYLDSITISATANYYYHFTRWQDNNTDNPRRVQVTQNKTYTAYFDFNQYSITLDVDTNIHGAVYGGGSYNYLSNRTIIATPNYGYHFTQWSDGDTNNPRVLTLTQDTAFTALFAKNIYTIIAIPNDTASGIVTGSTLTEYLDSVTIVAIPNYGYHFTVWSDGDTTNPRTIEATRDSLITAYFNYNQYSIILSVDTNIHGSVAGGGLYNYLSEQTINAIANHGYHFTTWNDGDTNNPRTITLTQDTAFTALFAKNIYTITAVSADTISGSVNGSTSIEYLDSVTIMANPNYGYHFTAWNDGNTDNPRIIVATRDSVFTASFGYNQYTITLNVDTNIHGAVAGGGSYNYLSEHPITATSNYGYHFTAWSDGDTNNPRTITLTQDTAFTALFAKNQYTLTLQSNDVAHGSVIGGGMFDYLDTVAIEATAVEHYHFVLWNDGNTDNPRQYVLIGNDTLIAFFAIDTHHVSVESYNIAFGSVTGGGDYEYGTPATVTATAYSGYQFISWSNGDTHNPYTFAVLQDTTLVAIFEAETQGIDDVVANAVNVYTLGGQIVVETNLKDEISIYDIVGRKVDGGRKTRFDVPASGVYLVKIGTMPTQKVVVVK